MTINDYILDLIRLHDKSTVGELSQSFNKTYPEYSMPRGELSKRVSMLKNDGYINAIGFRVCLVGGKRSMILTAQTTNNNTHVNMLNQALREVEKTKRRYDEALAFYNGLQDNKVSKWNIY